MDFAAFLDELEKIAVTRSVQEWRSMNAAGDTAGADAIAKAHGQLGAKPRYLEDISLGGAEAGVDKMMGTAGAQAGAGPNLQQRLEQYKANKANLGVEGRTPTQSVKSSPDGRATLLRGTQAPAQAAAPNESGYIARKLYKPDSDISRGEFTPQLLEQKQRITDQARSLSPEAKAMVPAMYGHQTAGTGGLQRTTSMHEYVPGLSDLRGKNIGTDDKPIWNRSQQGRSDLVNVQDKVLNPMNAKGMTMADTVSATGTNYGNVVNSPQGPKVLDFLPNVQGEKNPALESFKTYAPQGSQFVEGGPKGSVGQLRKEVFNPKMQIQHASAGDQMTAARTLGGGHAASAPGSLHTPANANAAAQAAATPRPGSRPMPAAQATSVPPSRQVPASGVRPSLAPAGGQLAGGQLAHAPTMPSAAGSFAHAPTVRPMAAAASGMHLPTVRPGAVASAAGKLEHAAATSAPGLLRRAGTALSRFH